MMYPIYKPLAEDALMGFVRFLTDRDLMWRRSPVPTESQTSDMSENGPGTTTWSMYGGRLGGNGEDERWCRSAMRNCATHQDLGASILWAYILPEDCACVLPRVEVRRAPFFQYDLSSARNQLLP